MRWALVRQGLSREGGCMEEAEKRCKGPCGRLLPFPGAFQKAGKRADGGQAYRGDCRDCWNAYMRLSAGDKQRVQKARRLMARWRTRNGLLKCASCLETKPAGLFVSGTDSARSGTGCCCRCHAQRQIENGYGTRRRALMLGAEYDGHQLFDLLAHWADNEMYGCMVCGLPVETVYHVDHNVPLISGGAHTLDNLVPLCPSHNTAKGGKCPFRFYAEHFPALAPYLEPYFGVYPKLPPEELAAREAAYNERSRPLEAPVDRLN